LTVTTVDALIPIN